MENREESVKARLQEFLHYKRITQREFTQAIGASPAYVAAMRKSVSNDKLRIISEAYPELNRDWLLYGTGEMINTPESPGECDAGYQVPLLPVSAFAGNLQLWSEGVRLEDCSRVLSPVKGADFAIPVCGDSMEPDFQDGSTVLIKKINDRAFIPWGNAMVIDTENGVLIKDLYPDDQDPECIIAVSRNRKYPPIHIPKSSVLGIYRVLCAIRIFSTM